MASPAEAQDITAPSGDLRNIRESSQGLGREASGQSVGWVLGGLHSHPNAQVSQLSYLLV